MTDDPKERILRAAMRCFADKGFTATTMADIELAAGFQPRTGGTYRHFRSKYAILDAALDGELRARDEAAAAAAAASSEAGSVLETARAALRTLDDQRDLMKVLFRDLDAFPELFERMSERLIQSTYRETADRIASMSPGADAEAIAAVTVGSLVNFKIIEAFTGRTPNDVDDERFAQAWAMIVTAAASGGAAGADVQQVPS